MAANGNDTRISIPSRKRIIMCKILISKLPRELLILTNFRTLVITRGKCLRVPEAMEQARASLSLSVPLDLCLYLLLMYFGLFEIYICNYCNHRHNVFCVNKCE